MEILFKTAFSLFLTVILAVIGSLPMQVLFWMYETVGPNTPLEKIIVLGLGFHFMIGVQVALAIICIVAWFIAIGAIWELD